MRRPVPAATAPQGLQVELIPTGTLDVAGPAVGASVAVTAAELNTVPAVPGAFHRSVTVCIPPGAMLGTPTV